MSAYRATEVLYPQPFGQVTAGAEKQYPLDLSHFTILGTAVGVQLGRGLAVMYMRFFHFPLLEFHLDGEQGVVAESEHRRSAKGVIQGDALITRRYPFRVGRVVDTQAERDQRQPVEFAGCRGVDVLGVEDVQPAEDRPGTEPNVGQSEADAALDLLEEIDLAQARGQDECVAAGRVEQVALVERVQEPDDLKNMSDVIEIQRQLEDVAEDLLSSVHGVPKKRDPLYDTEDIT